MHVARRRGEDVPPALLAIQEASGDAIRELRATLEVLRGSGRTDGEASGLDRLDDLVERARSTGLPATVTISGTQRDLPAEVDRAAYRIVQEALTNVSRHAGGAAAAVRIDYADGELVVRIDDDGEADPDAPPVPGTGLLGMRERVAALGGRSAPSPAPAAASPCAPNCPWESGVIRVLLVDDQALIRGGFRALLEIEDGIEVVAEAANGEQGVALAAEHRPDVALIDIQMPVMDGIEATRLIAADARLAYVHVVILTNYGLDEYVFNAPRAGACGFMVKDTEPADLVQGVRVAARGDALLSPRSPAA